MIFLLVAILLANFLFSYKYFKNIIAPPVLMSGGLLLACFIILPYYKTWDIYKICFDTVLAIGGGTSVFTLSCLFFSPKVRFNKNRRNIILTHFRIRKIKQLTYFYYVIVFLGVLGLFTKILFMRSYFGGMSLGEMGLLSREDPFFTMPRIPRMLGSLTLVMANFSTWLFLLFYFSKQRCKQLKFLLILQLIIAVLDGAIGSNKGGIIGIFTRFGIIFLFLLYAKRQSFHIKKSVLFKILLLGTLLLFSFKSLSLLIGRQINSQSNLDLVAEYCGAEIKNLDTYINSSSSRYRSKHFGAVTFGYLYSDLGSENAEPDSEGFQRMGFDTLGNVYTIFYSFHKDFGMAGCFICPCVLAFLLMFIYKKSLSSLQHPTELNLYLFLYASFGMSIFMSFFSNKVSETNINLGFLRNIIYMIIVIWIFKRNFIIKKKIHYEKTNNHCSDLQHGTVSQ